MSDRIDKRLEIVQNRINQYGMRFPVANIAGRIKFDRGYISAVLNGKKPMSDNFWSKFNETFPDKNAEKLTTEGQQNSHETPLPGHATLQDHIDLYKKWLDDKETKYQDSHSANMKLLDLLNTKLADIEANLKTGQHQMGEQLFAVGESLQQQLEGLSSGLAALAKDQGAAKKGTNISEKQRGGDGKGKSPDA